MEKAESAEDGHHPLAAEGGVSVAPAGNGEPYKTLDELMVVVEALCPKWPPRNTFEAGGSWLL